MADAAAACAKADKATAKAKDSGNPADHAAAAKAHSKAASALFAAGKPDEAKQHSKAAKKHKAKGGKSDSPAKNPLMAWMNKTAKA
jgi:hypothetical protein